jgi:HEPN domain-containing protein
MKPGTEYWLATSHYDFDTAKAMLVAKRYVYVVFMCHLCLEKVLKGALVELTDIETPPRIHALRLLAERAGLALTDEQGSMLDELTAHQQKTRYPDAVMTLSKHIREPLRFESSSSRMSFGHG